MLVCKTGLVLRAASGKCLQHVLSSQACTSRVTAKKRFALVVYIADSATVVLLLPGQVPEWSDTFGML